MLCFGADHRINQVARLFILGLGGLAGIVAASPVNVRGTRRVGAPATGGYRPMPA